MIMSQRSAIIRYKISGIEQIEGAKEEPYESLGRVRHKILLGKKGFIDENENYGDCVVLAGVGKSVRQCEAKREKSQDQVEQ